MKYFWRTRTADGTADDFASVIRHYLAAWRADSGVVIGYSRGAGVAPFIVNRFAPDVRPRVRLLALVGAERTAGFRFRMMDLFGSGNTKNDLPVMPEIAALGAMPLVCFLDPKKPIRCAPISNRHTSS